MENNFQFGSIYIRKNYVFFLDFFNFLIPNDEINENSIIIEFDKKNNEIENLIPLCPTHHQYVHSKYKHLVEPLINSYMEKYQGVG